MVLNNPTTTLTISKEKTKNVNVIFGKLLFNFREKKDYMLVSLLESVKEIYLDNNTLVLCVNSKSVYTELNSKEINLIINSALKTIDNSINLMIKLFENNTIDIEKVLKKEFGSLLKIK